ncbi:MAG: hypothetical protein ACK2UA_07245 [Anaerolineae bacterium]|jgi:hypothetical protein
MTTLAVLSDIHGVWPALKAVQDQKYPDEPLTSEMLDDYLLNATWEQYV